MGYQASATIYDRTYTIWYDPKKRTLFDLRIKKTELWYICYGTMFCMKKNNQQCTIYIFIIPFKSKLDIAHTFYTKKKKKLTTWYLIGRKKIQDSFVIHFKFICVACILLFAIYTFYVIYIFIYSWWLRVMDLWFYLRTMIHHRRSRSAKLRLYYYLSLIHFFHIDDIWYMHKLIKKIFFV